MKIFVTGYGPFLNFGENPSQWLAENSGLPHRILEVSYKAVDEFIASDEASAYDTLLHLGLAGNADRFRFETTARNSIGKTPDALGEIHGPTKIDPFGLPQVASTLWKDPACFVETERSHPSTDAGDYLCNYLLYKSIIAHPGKRVGFLHIPPPTAIALKGQLEFLKEVITILQTPAQ